MIMIVDYGRGNLFSIAQACKHLGVDPRISGDPAVIAEADGIILPGVGAFGAAMAELEKRGLVGPLCDAALRGTPVLGICLGMQLLMTGSEEFGSFDGLGLIEGSVKKLVGPNKEAANQVRIPNVGWRTLNVMENSTMLRGLGENPMVYFTHSYGCFLAEQSHVSATISVNSVEIPVAVHYKNIVGYQFHPEKSGALGLEMIQRFLELC